MTKEQILALTGMDENQFYDMYPDQDSFCADYPDACAQIQQAKYGGIHINPANKGKFTASANRAGMGVQEFASHVLANKEDYSSTQVKRANFARNAAGWKHAEGGELEQYQNGRQVRNPLFTNDINKIRNYQDSLYNYNISHRYNPPSDTFVSSTTNRPSQTGTLVTPIIHGNMSPSHWDNYVMGEGYDADYPEYSFARYDKPVQPYVKRQPQVIPSMQSVPYRLNDNVFNKPSLVNIPTPKFDYAPVWETQVYDVPGRRTEWKQQVMKPSNIHFENGGQLRKYQVGNEVVNFFPQLQQVIAEGPEPENVNSLVEYLDYSGLNYSKPNRARMAKYMGVNNYDFSAKKNTELLNRIKKYPRVVQSIESYPLDSDKNNVIVDQDGQIMMMNKYGGQHNMYQNGGYVVKSGDNLSTIAAHNNIPLSKLIALNPQYRSNPDLIHVGDNVNLGMTPMQRSNQEYGKIADDRLAFYRKQAELKKMQQYQVTPTDTRFTGSPSLKTSGKPLTSPSHIIKAENKKKAEAVVKKNVQKNDVVITTAPFTNKGDIRDLESGVLVDKGTNTAYVLKNHMPVDSFPVLTGVAGRNYATDPNKNIKPLSYLDNHPEAKSTPTGYYFMQPNPDIYGKKGFNLRPISAYGVPAPEASAVAMHTLFGTDPTPGTEGYDPVEGRRRMKALLSPNTSDNYASYGCVNIHGQKIDCLTGQVFPQGDTALIVDTRNRLDQNLVQRFKNNRKETGGDIFPAMKTNYRTGGYYGYNGKWHPNSGSADTYVPGGGYYFDGGGQTDIYGRPMNGSTNLFGQPINNKPQNDYVTDNTPPGQNPDAQMDISGMESSDPNTYANSPGFNEGNYKTKINPYTGFREYTKNGSSEPYTNIKKQDAELWSDLKDKGHGARWQTGQTDIQKFGRSAGKFANTLGFVGNVANIMGDIIRNNQNQNNMNMSAINMGSSASLYTNPMGASKGDYGVSGSAYGAFRPNKSSNMSFKGMYGRYGMEVPAYQAGGGFQNLMNVSPAITAPIANPREFIDIPNSGGMTSIPNVAPTINNTQEASDNTRVDRSNYNFDFKSLPKGSINPDAALEAIAGHESGAKKGDKKFVGKRTNLIGEGGKRATASGTYQITDGTLKGIYNNNKMFQESFDNFNQFKQAVKTNYDVEYAAAKALMIEHIKNFGPYALGAWYSPQFAKRAMQGDMSVYNTIPAKDWGNKITWGKDFEKKLNSYKKIMSNSSNNFKNGGQQNGGQVLEMDENEIQQFLANGGQLEFLD